MKRKASLITLASSSENLINRRLSNQLQLKHHTSLLPDSSEILHHNFSSTRNLSRLTRCSTGFPQRLNTKNAAPSSRANTLCGSGNIFIHETQQKIVKLPLSPSRAKAVYSKQLSDYDKEEIMKFKKIYYVSKNRRESELDDFKHNLLIFQGDQIIYRYEVKTLLGVGSFSQVYEAFDWKSKQNVAIKIIRNKPKYMTQSKFEIETLMLIKQKAMNLPFAHILASFYFRNHICIVFKVIGPPLCTLSLPRASIIKYCQEILSSLCFLHSHSIIHCDLKPSNILISPENSAFLIDMGTACRHNRCIYRYIQSRSYRAPEVIFGLNYTEKIDVWSFGCILFEMLAGRILFKGESEKDIVRGMVALLGKPQRSIYRASEKYDSLLKEIETKERWVLEDILPECDPVVIEVLKGCLRWDPGKRISADQGLFFFQKIRL